MVSLSFPPRSAFGKSRTQPPRPHFHSAGVFQSSVRALASRTFPPPRQSIVVFSRIQVRNRSLQRPAARDGWLSTPRWSPSAGTFFFLCSRKVDAARNRAALFIRRRYSRLLAGKPIPPSARLALLKNRSSTSLAFLRRPSLKTMRQASDDKLAFAKFQHGHSVF